MHKSKGSELDGHHTPYEAYTVMFDGCAGALAWVAQVHADDVERSFL